MALFSFIIYNICKILKRKRENIKYKYIILAIIVLIYSIFQIVWINNRMAEPSTDQEKTYNAAVAIAEGNIYEEIQKDNNVAYFESYSQQFGTAFIWSIIFKLIGTTNFTVIQYSNVIANVITIFSIYLICKELSKKYNVNKYLGIILIITFVTLPLLSTFVYGDLSSLAFALLSIYFIMKYTNTGKIRNAIFSMCLMLLSYMLRMNTLIFILGIQIYLFIEILSKRENKKQIIVKSILILGFFCIMIPASCVKSYYCNECDINPNRAFPKMGYLYMGMTESTNPGWYNIGRGHIGFYLDREEANDIYADSIKERANYFKENPKYFLNFYVRKLSSIWTENTYAGLHHNYSNNFKNKETANKLIDENLKKYENMIYTYQKSLVFLIFGISLIVIIQNRKNISNEVILLLTVFIGGFLFHILWEAKSRYVIPYIIVLIPLATIEIDKIKIDTDKLQKILHKS